ncbi:hypothetical protein ACS0TY_004479 [Phlomoides rotata]
MWLQDPVSNIQHFHNDALVITTDIADFDVTRIFVDTGSSYDIMFLECFKKMDLNVKLEPIETTLYGFAGGSTQHWVRLLNRPNIIRDGKTARPKAAPHRLGQEKKGRAGLGLKFLTRSGAMCGAGLGI